MQGFLVAYYAQIGYNILHMQRNNNHRGTDKEAVMSDMINEDEKIGKISIADGVVASIAGIAAIEVEGVSKLTGNISKELVAKLGKKNLANGVKVEITDGNVAVDLSLEVEYGTSIKKVSEDVQEKVKQAIENMTGLHVRVVNVVVSGIRMNKE